jgi:hypothetical protein
MASNRTNSLILLNAKSQTETEEAIKLIEYFGGKVRHVFVPDVLIGYVPPEVDHKVVGQSFISQLIHEEFNPVAYVSESKTGKVAISAWNHLLSGDGLLESGWSHVPKLGHDTQPPLHELEGEEANSPDVLDVAEADKYTSCYMIGRVAVGVILMESIWETEDWTAQQEQNTIYEILFGLDRLSYFASQEEVNLSWFYEVHYQV